MGKREAGGFGAALIAGRKRQRRGWNRVPSGKKTWLEPELELIEGSSLEQTEPEPNSSRPRDKPAGDRKPTAAPVPSPL